MRSLRRRLRNHGPTWSHRARWALVAAAAAGLGVSVAAGGADGAPLRSSSTSAPSSPMSSTTVPVALGSLVLAQPLPGLATAPAGPTNGVLTVGEFASQSSEPAQAEQQFDALAAKPGFGAFIRLWTDQGDAGTGSNDLAVLLFRINDVHTAQAFASGLNQPFEQASGSTRFAVPSVPGAQGYSVSVTTPVPAIERVVVFRAGRYVSMIELASTSAATNAAPLTPPQAVAISYLQLSQLRTGDPANSSEPTTSPRPAPTAAAVRPATPASTSTAGPAAVVAVVAAAVLVGLAAILWTRRRRTAQEPGLEPDLTIDPWGPAGVFAEFAEVGLALEEPSVPGGRCPALAARGHRGAASAVVVDSGGRPVIGLLRHRVLHRLTYQRNRKR